MPSSILFEEKMDFSSSDEEEVDQEEEQQLDFNGPLIGPMSVTYCGGAPCLPLRFA